MALTNDPALAERLGQLRTHGIIRERKARRAPASRGQRRANGAWYYEQIELGFNYRMTDIQAALGTEPAARGWIRSSRRRRELAARYDGLLGEAAGDPPVAAP